MNQDSNANTFMRTVDRRLLAISSTISFFLVSEFIRIAQDAVDTPYWQMPITNSIIEQGLFWFFVAYGISWIGSSFLVLRAISKSEELQEEFIKRRWWTEEPLLVQIIAFITPGIFASLYVLLTGDVEKGVMLAALTPLHSLLAFLFAPMVVRK